MIEIDLFNAKCKKGIKVILLISLLILGVYGGIGDDSFGFSQESGFYDSPFYLSINKPLGTKVYYTLDGSNPSTDSAEYTEPIWIEDVTKKANYYANVEEIVPENYSEKDQDGIFLGYDLPKDNIDKSNIVRAICVDKDGKVIGEKQATYFVEYENKSGYDGMWVVSITTDPDNLFSADKGIMVRGPFMTIDGDPYFDANFSKRGMDWEREAYVQFFTPQRDVVINQKCGIRIHGNYSRRLASKSFNLYARNEYDGNDKFLYDFWGDEYYPDKIMLLSGGQDQVSLARDKMVSDLTRGMAFESYHYEPCVVFLDGEYWGVHFISEELEKEYIEHKYKTDSNDLMLMKDWQVIEGNTEFDGGVKYNEFTTCFSAEEENGMSQQLFNKVLDYESFLDYFATETYIARNGDWPQKNISLWSSLSNTKAPNDGKWRFILYDMYTDSINLPNHDTETYLRNALPVFDYEMKDAEFEEAFMNKWEYLSEEVFDEEHVEKYLEEYSALMREPLLKHYKRFYSNHYDENSFDMAVDEIRDFFEKREEYISIRVENSEKQIGD